jgi:hypothetical protein
MRQAFRDTGVTASPNLDAIKQYFGFDYVESGVVHNESEASRTWFLERPNV